MTVHRRPRHARGTAADMLDLSGSETTHGASTWFVAYDIADPLRLRRVHRRVRREGMALQYSGFAVTGDELRLKCLLKALDGLIDPQRDDVRAYHLPMHCRVWSLGRQCWPEGLTLTGEGAMAALLMAISDTAALDTEQAAETAPDMGTIALDPQRWS